MSDGTSVVLSSIIAWLLGSIPFGLLIGRYIGKVDLRKHGSGNIGATNVARTMGMKWGALALLFDALKGVAPILIARHFFPTEPEYSTHQQVIAGVLAVVGHMFPPWLGFKGGKGVATALGVVTVLSPESTLIACGFFVVVFLLSRIVSLASILASISFGISQFTMYGETILTKNRWSLSVFAVCVPLLIIIRHRSNIYRLCRGEEKPLSFRRKKTETEEPSNNEGE